MELIRRVEGAEALALTTPLITTADGKKMGKTEHGAADLDPRMVSPYDFFQYWMNVADADVRRFLLLYTFLTVAEIDGLTAEGGSALNRAKEVLAYQVACTVHGETEAEAARGASRAAFGGSDGSDGSDLSAIPSISITAREVEGGIALVDLLARTALCSSRGEARRLLSQGGAYVNELAVSDVDTVLHGDSVRNGAIVLRAGKKRYFRVTVE